MGIYAEYLLHTNRVKNLQHHLWDLERYMLNKEGIIYQEGKQDGFSVVNPKIGIEKTKESS